MQLLGVLIFLLLLGLLPWIDNWAHASGFILGLLLSFSLFPYVQFGGGHADLFIRGVVVCVCLALGALLFILLLCLFYITPIWQCSACVYFNCVPLLDHFCDNEGLTLDPLPF